MRRIHAGSNAQLLSLATFIVALILVWEVLADFLIKNSFILPGPHAVAAASIVLFQSSVFGRALTGTALAVAGGFAVGAGSGLLVGFLIGTSELGDRVIRPYISFFMSVPKVIYLPLFIFAFGLNIQGRIYFGAFHAFFVMAANTAIGVKTTDPALLKLARSLRCSSLQINSKIVLPSAVPMILTGARYAFLLDFLGILLMEMYIATNGLGTLIENFSANLQLTQMLSIVVVISAITIVVNQSLILLEKRLSVWRFSG